MTENTIPPEALEAARVAMKDAVGAECSDATEERAYHLMARAACLAMLKAWPGMVQYPVMELDCTPPKVVLPLPTENTND